MIKVKLSTIKNIMLLVNQSTSDSLSINKKEIESLMPHLLAKDLLSAVLNQLKKQEQMTGDSKLFSIYGLREFIEKFRESFKGVVLSPDKKAAVDEIASIFDAKFDTLIYELEKQDGAASWLNYTYERKGKKEDRSILTELQIYLIDPSGAGPITTWKKSVATVSEINEDIKMDLQGKIAPLQADELFLKRCLDYMNRLTSKGTNSEVNI